MKRILTISLLFINIIASSQTENVIDWINRNSIDLGNLDGDQNLSIDESLLSANFLNARIYGFGEATHHNKEFFELKSNFLKVLVLNHGVKRFVLEESYGASFDINKYINGTDGNLRDLMQNFRQHIWKTEEMYNLINWMREYNLTQHDSNKIQFYGNDCMSNYKLISIIKAALKNDNIFLVNEEAALLDYFSGEIFSIDKKSEIVAKISNVKVLLAKIKTNPNVSKELFQCIDAFSNYLNFLLNPTQITRDKFMAEIVDNIYINQNDKIFVWAHNEHVKKTTLFREDTPSMGNLLHQKFNDTYYSMGFEFGIGTLWGFDQKKNTGLNTVLDEPVKNTNSEFLYDTDYNAFYFDFNTALSNESMNNFLSKKRNYVVIGGYGVTIKNLKYQIASEKYIDMFDGLIYVKRLTRSTPIK